MKRNTSYILFFVLMYGFVVSAQEDTVNGFWSPSAAVGMNLSQIALSNWTRGGENSITWTLIGNGGIQYFSKNWNLTNTIKITFGRTKLGGQDFRTNDNDLFIEMVLSKKLGWAVDPYLSNSIRTPITTSYNYKVNLF